MYIPTIGLEIHIELDTKSKMFCSCPNDSDERHPNTLICPICFAHPGTLPVINKEAVRKVIKTGLALNCQIAEYSQFDRKNYFYPDLPKGYQISQYDAPLCRDGYLEIINIEENSEAKKFEIRNPKPETSKESLRFSTGQANPKSQILNSKRIRIRRIHLEEDTGRLVHSEGVDYSLIDFNRAGIPLMELVTEPDIKSGIEAREFVKELQLILRYLGISKANMEKGEMRVEVNISLKAQSSKHKTQKLGTKVEIKNLNSLRVVEKAINYEIRRQRELLEQGKKIVQETRGWHDKKQITFSQREKEEAHDYRYFPEPDLVPLEFTSEFLQKIKDEIFELPSQKRQRFKREYLLLEKEIEIYITQKELGDYFEKVVLEIQRWLKEKKGIKRIEQDDLQKIYKLTSNYISTDLQGLLQERSINDKNFLITPESFAEFIILVYSEEFSSKIAKSLLKEMYNTGRNPSQIIEEKQLKQITESNELKEIIRQIIDKNPKPVQDYKKGKQTALQFLIGQVMAETKGRANPEIAHKIFKELLL